MISGEIAIVTSSGKAYYKLVTEMKKREIGFLSLAPSDPIPINVRAVVTTELDEEKIDHPQVFVYDVDDDPSTLIDRLIQRAKGKDEYAKLVFGVDPGKRLGLAVMGDGSAVRTMILSSVEDTAKTILEAVNRMDAKEKIVKIGSGASSYQSALIELLDEELPSDVAIESVEERGTTRHSTVLTPQKRRDKDIHSAIQISMRKGIQLSRRRKDA